ncbi:hypothetical protein HDU89_000211 [Geranomyces variabilis]|nr:hypothetical protein HDU89_000211 [Geranomyces variabilis]
MPDKDAQTGHHYHRERITVIEDEYDCGVDGDCELPAGLPPRSAHHTPGIVSKVKAFFLGPQVVTDEIMVEQEVKVRRVHHSEVPPTRQDKDDHQKRDHIKHLGDSARHHAQKKLHDVKDKTKHVRDEIEAETEEVKEKADSALSSIWSSLENAKARLDHALYGTEKKIEHAAASVEKQGKEAVDKLESARDYVIDESGRVIDKTSQEYEKMKEKATDKYERARQRAHEDAERLRARVNQGAEKLEEVGEDVAARAKLAAKQVKGTIAKATDTAKQAKAAVKQQVEEASEGIKHRVDDAANRVYDKVEATKDTIKDRAQHAKQGVKDAAHYVKEDVRRGVHSVKGSVEDGIHAAEDKAKGVYYRFEQAAECLGVVGPRAQGRHHEHDHGRLGHYSWDGAHHQHLNPVPVTVFYSALSCLWFLWLARRVWMARNRSKVYLGDGSHELAHELHRNVAVQQTTVAADGRSATRTTALVHAENHPAIQRLVDLLRAVEARSTFANIVPLFLILLGALELSGAYRPLLHFLSLVFLAGNILQSECKPDGHACKF